MDEIQREDALSYEQRLCHWRKTYDPRNDFEEYLLQLCVALSFQPEQIQAAQQEKLQSSVESKVDDQHLEVHSLGRQLFFDPCGPTGMYANRPGVFSKKRTSWNGLAVDPLDLHVLVKKLESTGAGCRWLLGNWSDLRDRITSGHHWQSHDRLKATRMLGRQPVDAVEDRRVADIQVASYAVHAVRRKNGWDDLRSELNRPDLRLFVRRVRERCPDLLSAADRPRARQTLIDIVDREIERLNEKVAEHEKNPRAKAEQTVARLKVDRTPEGERLRRYEAKCTSEFRRSIDMYRKIRGHRTTQPRGPSTDHFDDPEFTPAAPFVPEPAPAPRPADPVEPITSADQPISNPNHPKLALRPPGLKLPSELSASPPRGLSKREKRRARRETEQRELERRLADGRQQMSSHLAPMNESIKNLLARSPEAIEYLKTFLPPSPQ